MDAFNFWRERAKQGFHAWAQALEAQLPQVGDAQRVLSLRLDRKQLAEQFQRANPKGPLYGVPFLLKDLFDVAGYPTHASSTFLSEVRGLPSEDSAVYARAVELGGVFCGKTHMNEFAYGLTGENPHYGDCPHPQDPDRMSGGSSSGSAYAVAESWVPLAFGTDSGGSVRVPASWCNLYGVRLTPGLWTSPGCFPLGPSFDTIGWFTRDAESMRSSIGYWLEDEGTTTNTIQAGFYDFAGAVEAPVQSACKELAQLLPVTLTNLGETDVPDPIQGDCFNAYHILQSGEAHQVHEAWLDSFQDNYDPGVLNRLRQGGSWTAKEREWALGIQSQLKAWFQNFFDNNDCLILPTVPFPALEFSQSSDAKRKHMMTLTTPASICGLSSLVIPARLSSGLTVGLQILTPQPAPRVWARLLKAFE